MPTIITKKVLVADDDEGILDAISIILEDAGYRINTTTRAYEIYERIANFNPDIILLDVLMSGYDGKEICKKIKSDKHTKDIPLVMISAHPDARKGAMTCGADDFLAKPFEMHELLDIIEKNMSNTTHT